MTSDERLIIDGSQGGGGGQILRSSLALSLVTGRPFVIENIRKGRSKPGLMRQHLTAVKAALEISGGDADGATIGSTHLAFAPGPVRPGCYRFAVGTAGSTTLVLQAILPALLVADAESELTFEGGTHNPHAPPFDFLVRAYLPIVEKLGPKLEAKLVCPGFFPAGGGSFTLRITPVEQLGSLELVERGDLIERRVRAIVANLPEDIARRECDAIRKKTNWDKKCFSVESVEGSPGPGNIVLIELRHENVTEVFTGFGSPGLRAESVAASALREVCKFLKTDVPVGEYLADQILLPLAIGAWQGVGGGRFRTMALSRHSTTHVDILQTFLEVDIAVERAAQDDVFVTVSA
jgi:RNA 3'-terminal phosphate cyclase (ATP)